MPRKFAQLLLKRAILAPHTPSVGGKVSLNYRIALDIVDQCWETAGKRESPSGGVAKRLVIYEAPAGRRWRDEKLPEKVEDLLDDMGIAVVYRAFRSPITDEVKTYPVCRWD